MPCTTAAATKAALHFLNLVDFCMGVALLVGGFVIMIEYTHYFTDIFVWGPFFAVGGLLVFMVLSNTCGIVCPRDLQRTCPNCCSVFSDFLAFIVLAAELGLALVCLLSEPLLDKQIDRWMNACDTKYGPKNCPDQGDGSGIDKDLNHYNTHMAIVSVRRIAVRPA